MESSREIKYTCQCSYCKPEFNLLTLFWSDEERYVAKMFLQLSEEQLQQEDEAIRAKVKEIRETCLVPIK